MTSNVPICLFTFDRRPAVQYINDSLKNLNSAIVNIPHGPVHVLVDGINQGFLETEHVSMAQVHPIEEEKWSIVGTWNVHKRIGHSYVRAFDIALASEAPGVLICEDDIQFRRRFPLMLTEALEEMRSAGRTHSLLSLYSSQNFYLERSLYRGRFYAEYPIKYFFGGQAVYFPREILEFAKEFWVRRYFEDRDEPLIPNDLSIGVLGRELGHQFGDKGGLFRCHIDLVNHVGRHSKTGLGEAFHSSHTFCMAWNGSTR